MAFFWHSHLTWFSNCHRITNNCPIFMILCHNVHYNTSFQTRSLLAKSWLPWQRGGVSKLSKSVIWHQNLTFPKISKCHGHGSIASRCERLSELWKHVSSMHFRPLPRSWNPNFSQRWGGLPAPFKPPGRGGHIPPLGPPWCIFLLGNGAEKVAIYLP